jgi:hypothetical protein
LIFLSGDFLPKRGEWISQEELRNLWKVIEGHCQLRSFVPSPSAAETATPRTFLQPASAKVPKKAVKHEPLNFNGSIERSEAEDDGDGIKKSIALIIDTIPIDTSAINLQS